MSSSLYSLTDVYSAELWWGFKSYPRASISILAAAVVGPPIYVNAHIVALVSGETMISIQVPFHITKVTFSLGTSGHLNLDEPFWQGRTATVVQVQLEVRNSNVFAWVQ